MLPPWLAILLAPVLLYFGAQWLVSGCVGLALRLGVPVVVVGLFVVGYGTSAPEVVVCLEAAGSGRGELAVGNLIGSNLLVSTLMVGVAALVNPLRVHWLVPKFDAPVIVLIAAALLLVMRDHAVTRIEGALLLAAFAVFTVLRWWLAKRPHASEVDSEFADEMPAASGANWANVARVAGGLVMLGAGGWMFLDGAVAIAKFFGVSHAVIGLTLVSLGTCLPEMTTNLVAARRGHGDIVIANAVGSCVFNSLFILGFAGMISPFEAKGFGAGPLWWFAAATLVLLPILWTHNRVTRAEGAVLTGFYAAYFFWLIAFNP